MTSAQILGLLASGFAVGFILGFLIWNRLCDDWRDRCDILESYRRSVEKRYLEKLREINQTAMVVTGLKAQIKLMDQQITLLRSRIHGHRNDSVSATDHDTHDAGGVGDADLHLAEIVEIDRARKAVDSSAGEIATGLFHATELDAKSVGFDPAGFEYQITRAYPEIERAHKDDPTGAA